MNPSSFSTRPSDHRVSETEETKLIAKRLRAALADQDLHVSHSTTLELVARAYGSKDWNTLVASLRASAAPPPAARGSQRVVPILRIFDWERAQSFYLAYLGWTLDWEHRFEDHMPLYAQVSGPGGLRVHLSEHHGDGTPGSAVLIEVDDVEELHAELSATEYGYARPGVEKEPWGRTLTVSDPFGNRLTFLQPS